MDFSLQEEALSELERFRSFLGERMQSRLAAWYRRRELPREFFEEMGHADGYGYLVSEGRMARRSALREALFAEELARRSPGAAVAALASPRLASAVASDLPASTMEA